MPNPPYSGFVLMAVEGQDGLELEAYVYDERIATALAQIAQNPGAKLGFVVPPTPIGLRETLSDSGATQYFNRRAANRATAKTMTSALIDIAFPDTAA